VEILQWNDRFRVGIERIDYQHKYFVDLISWLSSKLKPSENAGLRQRYLEEIMKYAAFHFFSEETQMMEAGFPELKHHQELHRQLISHLSGVASRLEMGEIDDFELIQFLTNWFIFHTVEEDGKFAAFLLKEIRDGKALVIPT
jgi:hemerythrin